MAEKYSRWRDPATGVQPFLAPLPASTDSLPPLIQVVTLPFGTVLGGIRTLLVVLLLLAQTVLVEGAYAPLRVFPPVHAALTRAANAGIARLTLAVLGIVWINVETVQLRKTGRSPPKLPFDPEKGDLIVANSSSYVDLLYLAFRHNAVFILPVSSANGKIVGWRRVGLLAAVWSSGALPQPYKGAESLSNALKNAPGPVVLFPECTTSNNRALLKIPELAPPTKGSKGRIFVLAFKRVSFSRQHYACNDLLARRYPQPTRLASSLTYPIPSSSLIRLPLAHIWSLTSRLTPYTFTVRRLHPSESPTSWESIGETLTRTARLKKVVGLGWVEKGAFLEFRRVKGR
ncbi:vacuolar protein sorting protein vps66 [Rhodotorula toruloides]|uniref:Vacuolar protein sorting protein vps66 n=1 Tax=Rhodotorula toruloides TaxID=5286 RepID=A0A511K851_RHOTO|nr:vacuolar protein sorting protein vps66 [Rhodotorula toruloides]